MIRYIVQTDHVAGIAIWKQRGASNPRGMLSDELRITDSLRDRIDQWVAWCQLLMEENPPTEPASEEWDLYDNEGLAIAQELKRQLGHKCRVVYRPETARGDEIPL